MTPEDEDLTRRNLGARIRQRREAAEIPSAKFAVQAGIATGYLSGVELGHRLPSLDVLQRIADVLGVLVTDLLNDLWPYGTGERPEGLAPLGRARRLGRGI